MFARHVTLHGDASKADEVITSVRDQVLPVLRDCAGFKGQLLLIDREKGEAIGISLWDTEENMNASEEKVAGARNQTAELAASSAPEVRLYELAIHETT